MGLQLYVHKPFGKWVPRNLFSNSVWVHDLNLMKWWFPIIRIKRSGWASVLHVIRICKLLDTPIFLSVEVNAISPSLLCEIISRLFIGAWNRFNRLISHSDFRWNYRKFELSFIFYWFHGGNCSMWPDDIFIFLCRNHFNNIRICKNDWNAI